MWRARGVLVVPLVLLSVTATRAQTGRPAQSKPEQPPAAEAHQRPAPAAHQVDVDALPLDLGWISQQLKQQPAFGLDLGRPIFRLQVFGTRPRWLGEIDWLGTADGRKLPASYPWNDRFLDMVTPPEARSFGAFEGTDLLQVLATSYVHGLAARTIPGRISSALKERRERRAREEVDAAIAEWRSQREAEAGKHREAEATVPGEPEPPAPDERDTAAPGDGQEVTPPLLE